MLLLHKPLFEYVMAKKLINLTPVKHVRDGYKGWIDETTRMHELFTGNTDVPFQYRIMTHEGERRVAPEEDLEIDRESQVFPPDNVRERYAETREGQSDLNALGYSLSAMSGANRVRFLHECAVSILGVEKVVRNLCDITWRKVARGDGSSLGRYHNALKQWVDDLDSVLNTFEWHQEGVLTEDTVNYVISVKQRMKKLVGFEGELTSDMIEKNRVK